MTYATSKSAALKLASKSVTQISGSGTNYHFYVDRDVFNPSGSCMEVRASSYGSALTKRSEWIAINALEFMGKLDEWSQYAVHNSAEDPYGSRKSLNLLKDGLEKFGTGPTKEDIYKASQAYWDSVK